MTKDRNFFTVLAQVQAAVPEWETPLLRDLENVESSAWYRAPEQMRSNWIFLATVLRDRLGADEPEHGTWQSDVDKIVRDKE